MRGSLVDKEVSSKCGKKVLQRVTAEVVVGHLIYGGIGQLCHFSEGIEEQNQIPCRVFNNGCVKRRALVCDGLSGNKEHREELHEKVGAKIALALEVGHSPVKDGADSSDC